MVMEARAMEEAAMAAVVREVEAVVGVETVEVVAQAAMTAEVAMA